MSWAQVVGDFQKPVTPISAPALPATHKRCKECEKVLPLSAFYGRGEGNRTTSRCKPCYMAHQKRSKK